MLLSFTAASWKFVTSELRLREFASSLIAFSFGNVGNTLQYKQIHTNML